MSQSTAQADATGAINASGGNIGATGFPVWLQIALAVAGVGALIWYLNRKKG